MDPASHASHDADFGADDTHRAAIYNHCTIKSSINGAWHIVACGICGWKCRTYNSYASAVAEGNEHYSSHHPAPDGRE